MNPRAINGTPFAGIPAGYTVELYEVYKRPYPGAEIMLVESGYRWLRLADGYRSLAFHTHERAARSAMGDASYQRAHREEQERILPAVKRILAAYGKLAPVNHDALARAMVEAFRRAYPQVCAVWHSAEVRATARRRLAELRGKQRAYEALILDGETRITIAHLMQVERLINRYERLLGMPLNHFC